MIRETKTDMHAIHILVSVTAYNNLLFQFVRKTTENVSIKKKDVLLFTCTAN